MSKNYLDSYIYIQDDSPLESDFRANPRYDRRNKSGLSFDRSTLHLPYSGSLSSFNCPPLDTSQSTPRHCDWPGNRKYTSLNREVSSRPFLDVGDCQISRGSDFPRGLHPGRSSTCNVTIPCDHEPLPEGLAKTTPVKYKSPFCKKAEDHVKQFQLPRVLTNLTSKSSRLEKEEFKVHKWTHNHLEKRRRKYRRNKLPRTKVPEEIDLESQSTMELANKSESFVSKAARDILIAPEFASDEKTRRLLSLSRELYVAIVGCQLVFVLTSLLFGNIALAIIVTLLLIQSCFCHSDGRPVAYLVNATLSLAICVTVIVALAQDVSGLEPFRTEPVLKTLSYVYIPISFVFTLLSFFLAYGFSRLHKNEKKAIVDAANSLLGSDYSVDGRSLLINKQQR